MITPINPNHAVNRFGNYMMSLIITVMRANEARCNVVVRWFEGIDLMALNSTIHVVTASEPFPKGTEPRYTTTSAFDHENWKLLGLPGSDYLSMAENFQNLALAARSCLSPKKEFPPIRLLEAHTLMLLFLRLGSGPDTIQTRMEYPAKFAVMESDDISVPVTLFTKTILEELALHRQEEKVQIHICSDSAASTIAQTYFSKAFCHHPNVTFTVGEETAPDKAILRDIFGGKGKVRVIFSLDSDFANLAALASASTLERWYRPLPDGRNEKNLLKADFSRMEAVRC